MKTSTARKLSASFIAPIFLLLGFSSPLAAQTSSESDLFKAARDLGIPAEVVKAVNAPKQPTTIHKKSANNQKANQRHNSAQQTAKRPDPYAAKRRQIHLQNIERRKAHHRRLAHQQRLKQQRIQKQHKQQNNTHRNVWTRVYQGFRFKNYNNNHLVRKYTSQFSRDPRRIQRLADRSSDYLFMVVNELNRRNMPTEIALLPFVESAYRNTAYSHAGAAGMWQFIPATGRRYGLRQTRSYDARLDPKQATRAAFDYLQRLNKEFKGDWFLSLAAYNAGEFRVHREIAKNKRLGRKTDYWSLSLPRETRQYVPRLLAFKEIFRNPQAFRVKLKGIPNAPALATINVNKAVNLKKVAAHAGLPADTLTKINSGFLHGITTPKFSQKILLPRRHAGRLIKAIHKLPPAQDVHNKPAYRYRYAKKSRGRTYRVRRGDNLYRIARKYGTSVKRIKRLNRLRSNRIKPGKRLRV